MADAAEQKLYTLTEVSRLTKVSMPTLQRYKKLYQDRIPSVGEGRKQRYPKEALDVFRQLKEENVSRRGRPRKTAKSASDSKPKGKTKSKTSRRQTKSKRTRKSSPAKRAAQGQGKGKEELLTLTQISKITGISYPTLLRYVKSHVKNIPHRGTGRARRYKPEAVEVFKELRSQSRRGRKSSASKTAKKSASAKPRKSARKTSSGRRGPARSAASSGDSSALLKRIKELEKSQKKLERMIARQQKQIEKPYRVVLQRK